MRLETCSACLCAFLMASAVAPALQAAGPAPAPAPTSEIPRLDAWPEVPKEEREALAREIERLRKARDAEMGAKASAALIAMGAGVVPELLPKLGKEKDAAALARIEAVLTAVTDAAHTRLLAQSFADKSQPVRAFALARAAAFPDAGTRAAAEGALARAAAAAAAEDATPLDRKEHQAAALAVTAAGSLAGLEHLASTLERGAAGEGAPWFTALQGVRGSEATRHLAPRLSGEPKQKVAALTLLAGCGDRDAVTLVAPHLDDTENAVRIAAINALRGIVDGDPPLKDLAVFQAIEVAKEWKARVAR
jgi:hypothetical protein